MNRMLNLADAAKVQEKTRICASGTGIGLYWRSIRGRLGAASGNAFRLHITITTRAVAGA
ncbi:hypothetical protein AWB74_06143 [Caballeronia arvi]|uniref:Uncharacterized protein n=1 Tax=Caballeronia arvi TaxID=1777135 RepID=A0A158KLP7_9BURK|nr:hypothetical protein [Caballeronia arvi]SAL82066.1 hypothetical protein AWB74_06143 [Caballeronia arvi]